MSLWIRRWTKWNCGCGNRRWATIAAGAGTGPALKLRELHRMRPGHGLYALYLARIEKYRSAAPPPDWDGVTVFDEK